MKHYILAFKDNQEAAINALNAKVDGDWFWSSGEETVHLFVADKDENALIAELENDKNVLGCWEVKAEDYEVTK